ncbi:MAG: hypothetical protein AAB262_02755 [Elusimicrobiota bacterium]
MVERLILSVALASALWALLVPRERAVARSALSAVLLLLLSGAVLSWTGGRRSFPESFPAEIAPRAALFLHAALLALGAAALTAARGPGAVRLGAAFGLMLGVVGWSASRWPQLARALELSGWIFVGPLLAAVLSTAVALTAGLSAFVLMSEDVRPHARSLLLGLCAAWVLPTIATEGALLRWWGFGPRSLAEAAGVPTNRSAQTMAVLWLYSSRGHGVQKDAVRMAADAVDLSHQSLVKLSAFLRHTGSRDIFARGAVAAVRQGGRQWWESERALDARTLAVSGRIHPDYRKALDLIKAGPLNAGRFARLEGLAAEAARSSAGFEDVAQSQHIFEGFSAAYARFGDEEKARKWLYRVDNLWPVNEKKIEVTPVEDFRDGRVSGRLQVDGRGAASVRVGLFLVWKSSSASGTATSRLLSGSSFTDEEGRFSFRELGPGRYCLALMARPEVLRGRVLDSPDEFELGYDKPEVLLPVIRIERETPALPESFAPGGLSEEPAPRVPERLRLWPRR